MVYCIKYMNAITLVALKYKKNINYLKRIIILNLLI